MCDTHAHKHNKMHHWSCKEKHINTSHLNVTQELSAEVPRFVRPARVLVVIWAPPHLNIKRHCGNLSFCTPPCFGPSSMYSINMGGVLYVQTINQEQGPEYDSMGSAWGTQFQHRHVTLYNKFQMASIVPAQLSLTSSGKNASRLHYNPPSDTASVSNTFRLHHYLFRAYSTGLSWDSLLRCFVRLQTVSQLYGG